MAEAAKLNPEKQQQRLTLLKRKRDLLLEKKRLSERTDLDPFIDRLRNPQEDGNAVSKFIQRVGTPIASGLEDAALGVSQAAADIAASPFVSGRDPNTGKTPDTPFTKGAERLSRGFAEVIRQKNIDEEQSDRSTGFKFARGATSVIPFMGVSPGLSAARLFGGAAITAGLSPDEGAGLKNRAIQTVAGGATGVAGGKVLQGVSKIPQIPALIRKGAKVSKKAVISFKKLGLKPTVGEVSDSIITRKIQKAVGSIIGGSKIIKAVQDNLDIVHRDLSRISSQVATSSEEAGKFLQRGARNYVKRFKKISEGLWGKLDDFIKQDEFVPAEETINLVGQEMSKFKDSPALLKRIATSDAGKVLLDIFEDVFNVGRVGTQTEAAEQFGKIPYQALKRYRSIVGGALGDKFLVGNADRGLLKQIYATLTNDLQKVTNTKGIKAINAFNRANNFHRQGTRTIEENFTKIINDKVPERVFESAVRTTKAGGSRVRSILRTLTGEEQEIVRATVIKNMGFKNVSGEFSPGQWFTNFNKMSPEGKAAIFTVSQRKSLDALANVVKRMKLLDQSGAPVASGRSLLNVATVGGALVGSFFSFKTLGIATGGTIAGANMNARLLTNPRFVNWLTKTTNIKTSKGVEMAINQLSRMAAQDPDIRQPIGQFLEFLQRPIPQDDINQQQN